MIERIFEENNICELTDNSKHTEIPLNSIGIIMEVTDAFLTLYFIGIDKIIEDISPNQIQKINIKSTGDEHERKICDRCFTIKHTQIEFENNRIKKGGKITKRPSCRDCRKVKNGFNIPIRKKQEWMLKKPKLGEIFSCPICTKKSLGGISKHVLDHNHHTGEVRGFLCESCNTGIGRFDDNIQLVENAIKWLSQKSES